MMNLRSIRWCAAALLAAASWSSCAAPVTFGMTGTIDFSDSIRGFDPGQRVFAQFTFDSVQVDDSPTTPGGDYRLTSYYLIVPSMFLAIGRPGDGSSGFTVTDGYAGFDTYAVAFDLSPAAIVAGTAVLLDFSFLLEDPTATAFGSEDVPSVPPLLASFDRRVFSLRAAEPGGAGALFAGTGVIDALYVVPAPSSGWLLLTGLGLAGLAHRMQARRRQIA